MLKAKEPFAQILLLYALLSVFFAGASYGSGSPKMEFDFGCLANSGQAVNGEGRFRAVGPFVETRWTAGKEFLAARPFYSRVEDTAEDRELNEILWPWGMVKHRKNETDWRFFPVFGHDFDNTEPESRYRVYGFPFIYFGRSKEGKGYFALFPVGGTIREFLFRDEIHFVLFPLYCRSRVNDVVIHDYLWPFVSRSRGDGVNAFRVFPFYGESTRRDRWSRRFVMWPVWTSVRYDYPGEKGGGFILFPVAGHVRKAERESWMLIPPLFRWSTSESMNELLCPWPFVQYSSGEVEKFYLWPICGSRRRTEKGDLGPFKGPYEAQTSFLLWPIVHSSRLEAGGDVQTRLMILPLVYYESVLKEEAGSANEDASGGESEALARYFKLWPLVSYRREGENLRVRTLELWPLKNTAPVERNMAPVWTLYSYERDENAWEHELLWGLARLRGDDRGDSKDCSLLMGLLRYRREGLRREFRLLYFLKFGSVE